MTTQRTRLGWPRHLCCLALLSLYAALAQAQITPLSHYDYDTWSLAEGLPQITVNAVSRDAEGRLWIATENGLARFDGSTMEVFNTANTPALKTNWIKTLLHDSAGRLWVATLNNLVLYHRGQFTHVAELDGITSLAEDQHGTLWLGGNQLWTYRDQTLAPYQRRQSEIRTLLSRHNQVYVADRSASISRIDAQGTQALRLPYPDGQILVNDLAWHDNTLWAATDKGLFYWQEETHRFRPLSLIPDDSEREQAPVTSLASAANNVLWVVHHNDILQLVGRRVFSSLSSQTPDALPALRNIFADGQHSFWVGSLTAGLRYYWPSNTEQLGAAAGLTEHYTWSFWADRDDLLVGTNAGVFRYADNRFNPFVPASWLPGGVAYTLFKDSQKRLWVGTRQGLVKVNHQEQTTEYYPQLHGLQVNGIIESRDGTVYFGTAQGLFAWHQETMSARYRAELGHSAIRYLLEDRQQRLWVGTESGLWQQTPDGLQRAAHPVLANSFVTSMTALDDGRLVVGSYQDGIFYQQGERWLQVTQDQGLPSLGVSYVGHAGAWLWLLFSDGIYRIALASLHEDTSAAAPLQAQMVLHDGGARRGRSRIRCCNGAGNGKGLIADGWLWAPTLEGAVRVNIQSPQIPPPQAHIHRLLQAGTALAIDELVHIAAPKRDVEIHYSTVDFKHASSLRYRYRLRPYQTDWIDADDRLAAFYTNLPPGKFTFDVQAKHHLGNWGPSSSVTLNVKRFYYETNWFRVGIALLLMAWVYIAFRWRTHRLKQRQQQLQQEVTERTRELEAANSRLAQLNLHLQETSVTDELTGLRNRRFIQQQMPGLMARLARLRSAKGDHWITGIILIDLDYFKKVNDKYGHSMGDSVLQCTAKHLVNIIRTEDYLLRWGGEEFLLITPDIEQTRLPDIAERIRTAVMEATKELAIEETLSASLGVVRHPLVPQDQPLDNWQASIAAADFALYGAKAAGRNCCAQLSFNHHAHFPLAQSISSEMLERWRNQGHISLELQTKR